MKSYSSPGKFFAFRLSPKADLKKSILDFAKENQIKAGCVVTCVGSLEQFHLRFANQNKGDYKKGRFEIVSLTGTFSDGAGHFHISLADEKGDTIGGHLLDENFIYTTAEIVVAELTELHFARETDDTYGFQELAIKPKPV
ncbi:MAG: DNA-binding protein [Bacteroidetes bacterium]|nr:DNA-binding protein [Bacteroidota bacterium]